MEVKFNISFKTDLNLESPDGANAARYIKEYGMTKYLQNLQAYMIVVMEKETQELFANDLKDFEITVETDEVKLFNRNRDDIMRSAF